MALSEISRYRGFPTPLEARAQSLVFPRILDNGIDLQQQATRPEFQYEDACFDALVERFPDRFTVGPHIVDSALGLTLPFSGDIKPDALLLKPSEKPEQGVMLTGIAEFKSGKNSGVRRKIEGFSRLVRRLREKPHLLQALLSSTVDGHFAFPPIHIPPDQDIDILFLTQTEYPEGEEIADPAQIVGRFTFKELRRLTVRPTLSTQAQVVS